MKNLLLALALSLSSTVVFADGHDQYTPPDTSGMERDMLRNAERNAQNSVDRLIRQELERRRAAQQRRRPSPPPQRGGSYCGKSFWAKSDALNLCPPATAMKTYTPDGKPFYYCDCN